MSDLISRQDVIKAVFGSNLSACMVYGRSEEGMAIANELIQAIKNLPSAEPERKRGRWTRPTRPNTYERFCSECQEKAWFCGKGDYDFCPNCGADMRGGEDE